MVKWFQLLTTRWGMVLSMSLVELKAQATKYK